MGQEICTYIGVPEPSDPPGTSICSRLPNFHVIEDSENLKPWLPQGRPPPVQGIGELTAGQVVLLGGTRPKRILHTLVMDLGVDLDGNNESLTQARHILLSTVDALDSLVEHHVVVPVKGQDARVRKLQAFVHLGIAAQFAAMMGGLYEARLHGQHESEESQEVVRGYFHGAVQVFGRIELTPKDEAVFRDYYLEQADIEELAEERDRGLAAEIERRHGFLKRLVAAFQAEIGRLTGAAGRHPGDQPQALAGAGGHEPQVLTRAIVPAAQPRKR